MVPDPHDPSVDKVSQSRTDNAKNHAERAIAQSRKLQKFVQEQIAKNEQSTQNPAIAAATQAAQKYSEEALQFSQASLRYSEAAANQEGEASDRAFEQAVQAHVKAAEAQNKANTELCKINQQHIQSLQNMSSQRDKD